MVQSQRIKNEWRSLGGEENEREELREVKINLAAIDIDQYNRVKFR
jgi:hypothetical protein